jgi:hypothetical protein
MQLYSLANQYKVKKSVTVFILFICNLFNDAFSVKQTIQRRMKEWQWMMNWRRFGRKRSFPNFRYYAGIHLQEMGKNTKILSQDSQSPG